MRGAIGADQGIVCGAIPTRGAGVAGLASEPFCAGGVERVMALKVFRFGAFTFCHLPFPRNCCHCPLLRRKICRFPLAALCGAGLAAQRAAAPLAGAGNSCPGASP